MHTVRRSIALYRIPDSGPYALASKMVRRNGNPNSARDRRAAAGPPPPAPRRRTGAARALVRPGRWAQFYPLVPNVSLKRRRGPVMCTSTSFYTWCSFLCCSSIRRQRSRISQHRSESYLTLCFSCAVGSGSGPSSCREPLLSSWPSFCTAPRPREPYTVAPCVTAMRRRPCPCPSVGRANRMSIIISSGSSPALVFSDRECLLYSTHELTHLCITNQKTFSSSWELGSERRPEDCPPTATPALSRQVTSGLSPSWKMSLELWCPDPFELHTLKPLSCFNFTHPRARAESVAELCGPDFS